MEPTPGHADAERGTAHFLKAEYQAAAACFQAASQKEPGNADWREMRDRATVNAVAEIHVFVPEATQFERAALLRRADASDWKFPSPPRSRRVIWPEKVRRWIGTGLGALASWFMQALTFLWGTIVGYKDRVWTNWYRRSVPLGILTLSFMRERLNKKNLKSTYPKGSLVGFQEKGQKPPPGATHFRTADGSWNDFEDPMQGAAGTRFLRNVDVASIRPETGDRLLTPNPRTISRKLLTRGPEMKEVPFLNLLAASWIQFENHDWVNHGEVVLDDWHEIPLAPDDPARARLGATTLKVGKSQPDPTWTEGEESAAVTFVNEVTHWWDGSQIYGSDQETQNRLRSFADGKLRVSEGDCLPVGKDGVEDTGFRRNWWIGLTILHTLFLREHNAICDRLKVSYPHWDDNRLFNVARLINAAVMAKIHTVEWTPAILPNPGLDSALNANWYGVLTNLLKFGKDRNTLGDINIRNPELGGVVGNPINAHGEPYGLSQEFVEVYRLHSLLPEALQVRKVGSYDFEAVPTPATRQAGSRKLASRFSMADVLFSFGVQHPGQLVLNNYPRFMQEMSIPGNPLVDLGAIDILRARERGVPRYNEFRRQLGLGPIRTLEDLTDDKEQVAKLKEVYGDGPDAVENLDLLVGTLSEGHRPTNFGFGETMFQIFILNASRRLQADRFYTDSYNEETYTKEGLEWIDSTLLKTVLLRHYPELGATGLANVSNAFEPWDLANPLDPARHPLRACSKELKPDPWVGDAHR